MNLGKRLKALRESRELTLEQVGSYLGVNKATAQRYESGDIDIKRTVAVKLAEVLRSNPAYIMGWSDTPNRVDSKRLQTDAQTKAQTKKVPLVGDTAAGWPLSIPGDECIEDWVTVDETDNVDYVLRVKGDSMTGVGIYDGDLIFVRKQPTVNNGEIAIVIIDDGHPDTSEATCKRFYQYGKTVLLRPESHNPEHKDREIKLGRGVNVRVHGKVVFSRGFIEGR